MNFTPIASSSAGNSYLVSSPGVAPLLIECGIPIKRLREKFYAHDVSLSDLAGCLVSHEHMDHAKAVKDLLKMGVDIWTSKETAEALGIEFHYRTHWVHAEIVYQLMINSCVTQTPTHDQLCAWKILPFDLHHDVPTHGFFIADPDGDKLLFIPDTSYIRNRFIGINLLAIECNFISDQLSENIQSGYVPAPLGHRIRRNHMSLDSVIAMLKANDLSRCRHIYLLHLSDANSDEALMIRQVQEATGIPCSAAGEM